MLEEEKEEEIETLEEIEAKIDALLDKKVALLNEARPVEEAPTISKVDRNELLLHEKFKLPEPSLAKALASLNATQLGVGTAHKSFLAPIQGVLFSYINFFAEQEEDLIKDTHPDSGEPTGRYLPGFKIKHSELAPFLGLKTAEFKRLCPVLDFYLPMFEFHPRERVLPENVLNFIKYGLEKRHLVRTFNPKTGKYPSKYNIKAIAIDIFRLGIAIDEEYLTKQIKEFRRFTAIYPSSI